MDHAGVTCSDCHDPHSNALRSPGNGVCLQCHLASKYDGCGSFRTTLEVEKTMS
ncbi:MAG: cytochrome c3 family protein [Gammaproteobacteria bacterium]